MAAAIETSPKGFQGVGFGSQSNRFDISQVHPKWRLPGTFMQVSNSADCKIGPGYYDALQYNDFSEKNVEARAMGPNWKRVYEMSQMSKIPHLMYREQYEQKMEQKRKLGPGTYDVADSFTKNSGQSVSKRGFLDSREPRFRNIGDKEQTPGPGVYGKDGIPQKVIEEKEKLSFSRVGILEGGVKNRSLPQVGTDLGPGTYEIKSFSEETIGKRAGKYSRGPYEVFSLDRNKPIMTGHYATYPSKLGPGQYGAHKDGITDMNRAEKRNHGKFLKMVQYPDKPCDRVFWMTPAQMPPDPKLAHLSPATYSPTNPLYKRESYSKGDVGFLSNCSRQDKAALVFFTKNFNQVGPGRYDIQKMDDSNHVNGHTNDFLSKTSNGMTAHDQQVYRERLRPKDIPPGKKFHVDHVPTIKEPFVNIQSLHDKRAPLKLM